MNGKIDEYGFFWLKRANEWKRGTCPNTLSSCGDHCVLFGEPEFVMEGDIIVGIELEFCNGSLFLDSMTDERGITLLDNATDEQEKS